MQTIRKRDSVPLFPITVPIITFMVGENVRLPHKMFKLAADGTPGDTTETCLEATITISTTIMVLAMTLDIPMVTLTTVTTITNAQALRSVVPSMMDLEPVLIQAIMVKLSFDESWFSCFWIKSSIEAFFLMRFNKSGYEENHESWSCLLFIERLLK